jgi:hypothetical protein
MTFTICVFFKAICLLLFINNVFCICIAYITHLHDSICFLYDIRYNTSILALILVGVVAANTTKSILLVSRAVIICVATMSNTLALIGPRFWALATLGDEEAVLQSETVRLAQQQPPRSSAFYSNMPSPRSSMRSPILATILSPKQLQETGAGYGAGEGI